MWQLPAFQISVGTRGPASRASPAEDEAIANRVPDDENGVRGCTASRYWARLMQAQNDELSPEAAEFLLSIDFGEGDRLRMLHLAERSNAGILTPEEQVELDGCLHIGNLLAVMQSKARLALKRKPLDHAHS
jgi:hypothetical protein